MKTLSINYIPLGLFAFSITSILVNLHGLGLFPLNALVLSMALIFGGGTQLFVGLVEYKQGNNFAGITFSAYGLYWLSYVGILLFPLLDIALTPPAALIGFYFLLWAVFTSMMSIIARRISLMDFFIFCTLALLYFLLTLHQFLPLVSINILASLTGIICGGSAFYLAIAKIFQQELGQSFLPMGIVSSPKNE